MSTVILANPNQFAQSEIHPDSLLDFLYTYFTLNQLQELLENQPAEETLRFWNVSSAEFKSQVRLAIEYVVRD